MSAHKYDLIVIGSGILGTFHAYHAALMGKSVLILEKDARPVNATVRNFGMVIPSGMDGEWFRYGVRGTSIYQQIQQQYDISVRNNGTVYFASDEDEQQLLHELKQRYDQLGYACELLDQRKISLKYPSIKTSYAREALFFPGEISVEPGLMIHQLHAYMSATFRRLQFSMSAAVIGCEPVGDGVAIVTAQGERFLGSRIVVASGHEFRLLFPQLFTSQPLIVCKLHMMKTAPQFSTQLPGNIATGLSIRRYEAFAGCPSFARLRTPEHLMELKELGIHLLFKQATDGSVIIGDSHQYAPIGKEETLGFQIDEKINQHMLAEARRIVDIDLSAVTERWAGYYSLHSDKEIFEYDIEDLISIRVGIGGKGMTCSAGYAEENIHRLFGR